MLKSTKPDQTKYTYQNKVYSIYDAFPTIGGATKAAESMRTLRGRIHTNTYTRAIVVDLGKDAGRLRYATFTAKGRPI